MKNVNDVVDSVVREFLGNNELFTALDVSNKVKEDLPLVRHREVRDLVRSMFSSVIEVESYTKTPITVNLENGATAEAILYHPLVDSWDLDAKYNAQKRAQSSVKAKTVTTKTVTAADGSVVSVDKDGNVNISVGSGMPPNIDPKHIAFCGTKFPGFVDPITVQSNANAAAPVTVKQPSTSKDLWNNLFNNAPSLFPRS